MRFLPTRQAAAFPWLLFCLPIEVGRSNFQMIAQRYFIFHFYRLLFEPTKLNGVSDVHYLFGSDVVHSFDSSITISEFLFAYFSENFS